MALLSLGPFLEKRLAEPALWTTSANVATPSTSGNVPNVGSSRRNRHSHRICKPANRSLDIRGNHRNARSGRQQ